MKDFRDLKVWHKARDLVLEVYRATRRFPKEEMFGLQSQLRRASVSIAANIAEGCGRSSGGDFARFLYVAMGSASELESHIEIAKNLQFLESADHEKLISGVVEVKRMLAALIVRVNSER